MGPLRATCGNCGDIEVKSENATVQVLPTESYGSWFFDCPCCGVFIHKDIEPRVVALLVDCGVKLNILTPVDELDERKKLLLDGHPVVNHDDLEIFTILLQELIALRT